MEKEVWELRLLSVLLQLEAKYLLGATVFCLANEKQVELLGGNPHSRMQLVFLDFVSLRPWSPCDGRKTRPFSPEAWLGRSLPCICKRSGVANV